MTNPLLARFIPEARELLESSSSSLLALEKRPDDATAVNEVFRAVHTLKGSSGLFDALALTKLVHVAEDLLGAVRSEKLALNPDIVDDLFAAFDQVSVWIGHMEETKRLPADADKVSGKLSRLLRAHLTVPGEAEAAPVVTAAGAVDPAPARPMARPVRRGRARRRARKTRQGRGRHPDPLHAAGKRLLLRLRSAEPDAEHAGPDRGGMRAGAPVAAASEYEPYQCNLVFTAMADENEDEIAQHLRYEMEHVTLCVLRAEVFPQKGAARGARKCARRAGAPRRAMSCGAQHHRQPAPRPVQRRIRARAHFLRRQRGRAARRLAAPARLGGGGDRVGQRSQRPRLDRSDAEPARTHRRRSRGFRTRCPRSSRRPHPNNRRAGAATSRRCPAACAAKAVAAVGQAAPEQRETEKRETKKSLRVDQAKIDLLMNLIGELIVSKNSLPFLARRAEDVYGSREMSREIKDQYAVIDRLAQEMQSAIMAVRMLPVSDVFDRFPRLVRDVARRLGKEVELTVEGGDTAADKTIIEALGDPLLHIVRNSLDHGVEPAEERRAADKPVVAALALRAYQEADSVLIEVEDDGRGIDPARIRAAAIEKGVISAERAAALSDSEAVNLIFAPGFSTAKQVSDLSGRGVGLDVVRTAIEGFGGRVQIVSNPGKGALTRLILPLSMAVTRIMIIEGAGGVYGVPMDMIVETVRIDRGRIHRRQAERGLRPSRAVDPAGPPVGYPWRIPRAKRTSTRPRPCWCAG